MEAMGPMEPTDITTISIIEDQINNKNHNKSIHYAFIKNLPTDQTAARKMILNLAFS
jgi:hypothetical protein